MTRTQFDAIRSKLEKGRQGGTYQIEVVTSAGRNFSGAWAIEGTGSNSVLSITCGTMGREKFRTFHVDLSQVEVIALAE